jgi:hypothetical protein
MANTMAGKGAMTMNKGDIVWLRSGSPDLIVQEILGDVAVVTWGDHQKDCFRVVMLTREKPVEGWLL